jgi:competence protein ComEC
VVARVSKLDTVALTHGHQDHVGGLTAVLQNFRVSRLWLEREKAAPAFRQLRQVAARVHVPIESERRAESFLWDGVQVDLLWPEAGQDDVAREAKNNDSLVVRLHYYGERTILLPGDAEKQVEYTMLAENEAAFLHADVLKVGHHGSKNSTMPEFLAAVNPHVAIVSSGAELLARLEKSGARVLRTDTAGAVQVLTHGHQLQVSCYEACPAPVAKSAGAQVQDQAKANQ